jgi:hypothetical protein
LPDFNTDAVECTLCIPVASAGFSERTHHTKENKQDCFDDYLYASCSVVDNSICGSKHFFATLGLRKSDTTQNTDSLSTEKETTHN